MRRNLAPLLLLGLWLAGCAGAPAAHNVAVYRAPSLAADQPRRVVLVPLTGERCSAPEAADIATALSVELQKVMGYDVVAARPGDSRLSAEAELWRRGTVAGAALIEARESYRADALLFGTITHYKAYDPPMLGLKLRLLSAASADVLWSADALFDASDCDVRDGARDYFKASGLNESLYGPNLVLMSPRIFAKYVAHEVVSALQRAEPAATAQP